MKVREKERDDSRLKALAFQCMRTHTRLPIPASNFHPVQKSAMQIRQELWTEMDYPRDILVTSDQDISLFSFLIFYLAS